MRMVLLCIYDSSEFKCSFVIGKLRIAPVKENSSSIPKLEPQAAVTASRIKVKNMKSLPVSSLG